MSSTTGPDLENGAPTLVTSSVRVRLGRLVEHYLHCHCGIKMSGMSGSSRRARTKIGLEHQLVSMAQDVEERISGGLDVLNSEALTLLDTLLSAVRDVQFRDDNFLVQEAEELRAATEKVFWATEETRRPETSCPPDTEAPQPQAGPTVQAETATSPEGDGPTQRVGDYASCTRALEQKIGAVYRYGPVAPDEVDLAAWDRPRPITALGCPVLRRLSSGRLVRATAVPLAVLMTPTSHDAQLLVTALLQSLPVALVSEVDRRHAGDSEFKILSCVNLEADQPVSALAWLFRACELGATDLLVVDTCGEDYAGRINLLCSFAGPEDEVVIR